MAKKVTMIGVNMKLLFFLVFSLIYIKNGHADDILGCGGFVKSHVTLDFSKIEIGLYTKDGSLKEKTECAPTNGYYFLPLYEKGDYVLKVHPPAGWSFEPAEVNLNIDGETDACSVGQDINFQFNGFGITGRVITAGQKLGPSGVSVQLVNDKGEVRNTVTTTGGDFHFTPVIPGKYTVKASHPRWKLEPAQAVVQVKEGNTALPTGVLAVKGYDVKGSVTSFGAPMSGLYVLLYAKDEKQLFRVEGCKTALLQGVPDSPICHSVTDSNGEFSFGLVPAGHYSLRALSVAPGQNELSLNVGPEVVPFSVQHDSLYIKNAFEVSGFTVVGSLLASVGGAGVGGARVELDGRAVGTTDAGGKFTLPALKPGNYLLNFLHEKCEADTIQLQVTPAGPTRVPHAAAARWRVCGAVSPPDHRDILIEAEKGPVRAAVHSAPENDGKWCTFLPPGVYVAKVELSEQEQREGMQFFPVTQKFSVGNGPVDGVSFSQLKGTVSGRVVCLRPADCNNLPVMLRPLSPDGGYIGTPMKAVVVNGEYSFKEVPAGSAELSVPTTRLCWREARLNVAVAHEKVPAPAFHHTGYVLRLSSQHELEVEYTGPDGASGVLQVSRGASSACVPAAGRYTLAPRGCHQFRPPTLTAATAANDDKPPSTIYFAPVAHAVTVRVLSPVTVNDLTLTVGGTRTGPLTSRPHPDGGFIFEHTMYMADGEVSVISAQSSSLLFEPSGPQQVWGIAGCQAAALTLRAVRGLTKSGRVVPAVEGATVTLTGDGVKLTQLTTKEGTYSFGPLDASKDYTVTLEKESYVFSAPDDKGNVVAKKLAEITVELVDDADGTPLQGALVSVSGGTYRRNALAGPGGRLVFAALSPNQYYVKPNMKEYRFTPPHTIVALPEGHSHHLALRGVRVAWSCVGSLVSLGGAGRAGALLAAVPTGAEPHCAVEEATTEANGAFRIRGLLPNCVYTLQLKESSTPELAGLKLAKAPPTLEVKDNKDIENVRLIAIQPAQLTDGGVVVRTPSVEHYKTLKLTLAPEAAPHSPVYTVKLDSAGYSQQSNPGLAYTLPRLPADNKTYVLQLESTLSKSTHSYDDTAIYFNSDGGFKSFFIEFLPKVKSSEQELRQTSLLVVPLLGLLAVMYLHRDALLARALSLARAAPKPRARSEVPERPEGIPGLNVPGKRVPKKKAL
ncbi:nodal modulator 1 [Ostrinia furnacalis]|uniref:nodal modulator 1 n=1 Tax=Ostrinia furnacalis TaxID=93504 RepID=UPI00103E7B79|nr:nodal modulator 1 [Ostrinia furnacalis]